MGRYYILKAGTVVEEPHYPTWAKWYEEHFTDVELIARTELVHGVVLTRFLAMNMTLTTQSEPLVFETRIKGGWLDDTWERFATIDEARTGHDHWVSRVREAESEEDFPPPGAHW